MICDKCGCETPVIHITKDHERLCTECYEPKERKDVYREEPE